MGGGGGVAWGGQGVELGGVRVDKKYKKNFGGGGGGVVGGLSVNR